MSVREYQELHYSFYPNIRITIYKNDNRKIRHCGSTMSVGMKKKWSLQEADRKNKRENEIEYDRKSRQQDKFCMKKEKLREW